MRCEKCKKAYSWLWIDEDKVVCDDCEKLLIAWMNDNYMYHAVRRKVNIWNMIVIIKEES